jgi:hypothetical protein
MSSFATLGRTIQPRAALVGGARRATSTRAVRGMLGHLFSTYIEHPAYFIVFALASLSRS